MQTWLLNTLPPEERAALKALGVELSVPYVMNALEMRRLAPGTPAPDFLLPKLVDKKMVRLGDYCGKKPVVLLFGSFGCNVFCEQFEPLKALHQKYRDRAEFLFIYITEGPHPDPLPPPANPEDFQARIRRGLRHFGLPFICLLDNPDARVQTAYSVFTQGLIIVDRRGRIALDAGVGLPSGWNLEEAEALLKRLPPS
jgi:hypothetical protein